MNPRVAEYLNRKQAESQQDQKDAKEKEKWEAYRRDVLICAGLYDKIYGNEKSEEYCYSEWDPITQTDKYFKIQPLSVTDEEFAQIQKYSAISFNK